MQSITIKSNVFLFFSNQAINVLIIERKNEIVTERRDS